MTNPNDPQDREAQRSRYLVEQRKADAPQPSRRAKRLVERWLRTYDDYRLRGGRWAVHLDARRVLVRYWCRHGGRLEDFDPLLAELYDFEVGDVLDEYMKRVLYRLARCEAEEENPSPF